MSLIKVQILPAVLRADVSAPVDSFTNAEPGGPAADELVSVEQHAAMASGAKFMVERAGSLPIKLAQELLVRIRPMLCTDSTAAEYSGVGSAEKRTAWLHFTSRVSPEKLGSLACHETFHAMGAVKSSGVTGEWALQGGFMVRAGGATDRTMFFRVLEEAAAMGNDIAYFQEVAGQQLSFHTQSCMQDYRYDSFGPRSAIMFKSICKLTAQERVYDAIEAHQVRGDDIVVACRKVLVAFGIRGSKIVLPRVIAGSPGNSTESMYSRSYAIMLELATELYPASNKAESQRLMTEALTCASLSGDLRPVTRKLKSAFGFDSPLFFALCDPNYDSLLHSSQTRLLGIFSAAKKLPEVERQKLRSEICEINRKYRSMREDDFPRPISGLPLLFAELREMWRERGQMHPFHKLMEETHSYEGDLTKHWKLF